jgi:predicted 3-demethylubiquinone-9 3-methyltransferase (glyoxalase superfamily)
MDRLTSLFPGSRIDGVTRYEPGEGPTDTVKHGMFTLDGQRFIAMDAHGEHGFGFNEATSLSVRCRDQEEVDRYWDALGDGGAAHRCGWLKDRFGISWQIVPQRLVELQESPDRAARDRMFQAMMTMGKLDVAGLERAFRGG